MYGRVIDVSMLAARLFLFPVGDLLCAACVEWFDIHKLVLFNQPPVAWIYFLLACIYAAAYTAVFLFASWLAFRHKSLTT